MDDYLKHVLEGREFLLFDGAMGTMLQRSGLEAGELPELEVRLHRFAGIERDGVGVGRGPAEPRRLGEDGDILGALGAAVLELPVQGRGSGRGAVVEEGDGRWRLRVRRGQPGARRARRGERGGEREETAGEAMGHAGSTEGMVGGARFELATTRV